MNDRKLREEVGRRLRVTAHELGYRSAQQLADYLDCNRPQVAAWLAGYAMAPIKYMRRLADEHRLTLDWIYRGDINGLPYGIGIRLAGAMEKDAAPPPDVRPEPEPEPEPESVAPPPGAGAERPREQRKRATAA